MVKHVCLNGTMVNTDSFSSPVPVVGLYIAAVSLLCFLLILCDVWAGCKAKKIWFPCRFFSFNSITLTLISVATKIPVDLTTSMPRVQDQLSKLSGTVFICVTMSFMLSSVATNAEFESYANVTALSIFVITVVVNICIQLATGVIFTFIPEHIIIMVCMMLLLIRFWFTVSIMNSRKVDYIDEFKDWIRKGEENMLARLKVCYLHSYQSCLQLAACRAPHLADVAIVCLMSSVVLGQAIIRSVGLGDLRFCLEVSDYGWSMWWVVVSQILTVAVVSLVVGFRCTLSARVLSSQCIWPLLVEDPYTQFQNLLSFSRSPRVFVRIFRYVLYFPLCLINLSITAMNFFVEFMIYRVLCVLRNVFGNVLHVVFCVFRKCCCRFSVEDNYSVEDTYSDEDTDSEDTDSDEDTESEDIYSDDIEKLESLFLSRGFWVHTWVLRKAVEDMQKWIEINKKSAVRHVVTLLSTVSPSEISASTIGSDLRGIKLSSISMILMAKVMMRTKPSSRRNISSVLGEVFEIIQYIESNLQAGSSKDRRQSALAKSIHKYGVRSGQNKHLLQHVLDPHYPFPRTGRALDCICECLTLISDDSLNPTMWSINKFIYMESKARASNEVVYGRLEQLFVDMLHAFLAQLPVAVYTHIFESPVEEIHERVRVGLGFVCKLEPLKSHVRFSLPSGCNITSLFSAQTSATNAGAELTPAQGQSTNVPDPTTVPAVDQGEIQTLEDLEMGETRMFDICIS